MRIATNTLHQVGAQSISKNLSDLYKIETQMSSGKKLNSAADDPVGAVRASELGSALRANTQFARNQTNAQNTLQFTESVVGDIGDVITSMQELVTQAGNGALSASDKRGLAASMRSKLSELVNLANTRDQSGRYLFSGFNDMTAPFELNATGINYYGDAGIKALQVSSTVTMPINVSGSDLLLGVQSGNGIIETASAAANTGGGIVDGGRVIDATAYDGSAFQVSFANGAGGLEYSVVNTTTGTTVVSGQPFTSASAIEIPLTAAGSPVVSMTITGTPNAGDTFTLGASTTTDPFSTLQDAIAALEGNAGGTVSNTQLADVLRRTGANLVQSADQALLARGEFGNALAELERQVTLNTRQDTDIQSRRSAIVDLDYAKAAAELTQAQLAYQASQSVYSKLGKQSLFDYL